jgi:excisionase family DNA binding protein
MHDTDSYLLRPAEVIEMLGVSRSWLYDAARAGRIPCVRLGGPDGPVRFRASELDAWIDASRLRPDDPAVEASKASEPSPESRRLRARAGAGAPVIEQLRLIPGLDQ